MKRFTRVLVLIVGIWLLSRPGAVRAVEDVAANDIARRTATYTGSSVAATPSYCRYDDECNAGLVCAPDPRKVAGKSPGRDPLAPTLEGKGVCQPGCRIDGAFRWPNRRDVFPNNCRSCQPQVSTTQWTPVATGAVCNRGSGDVCDPDEVCNGNDGSCPEDSFESASLICRAAAGDCDVDDYCTGVAGAACPDDQTLDSTVECRPAAYSCDVAEFCDGSVDCPDAVSPQCADGTECDSDERCVSGSCNSEVCSAPVSRSEPCDSTPDCSGDLLCEDGFCRSAQDGACSDTAECSGDLICGVASGLCKLRTGAACGDSSECANGNCDPGTGSCRAGQNSTCLRTEDCASGLICACDTFTTYPCPVGQICMEDRCDPSGVCKVPLGGECGLNSDCGLQQAIAFDEVHCPAGTCELLGWPLGRVCETDPPSCFPDCGVRPAIGDSPNDDLCESGVCFASVESPATFSDPPDYVCCGDINQSCANDSDCCANWGFRLRGCGSQGVCIALSIARSPDPNSTLDGRCFTKADCVRDRPGRTPLTCSVDGFCIEVPPEPGPTANGDPCTVNNDCQSLHCANTRDDGRLCLPPNTPGNQGAGFGETCDGDGFLLRGDPEGRQCTDTGGRMVCCSGGQLAQSGETGRCRQCCRTFDNEDPIGCKDIGDDEAVKRCVGPNGPTTTPCTRNRDCPSNHECIVAMHELCCGGRCINALFDENNCGQCGNECAPVADANACLEFDSCGGGRTPGVCEYNIPCEPVPGMGVGCYDSREDDCPSFESCLNYWITDPRYAECVANRSDCWDTTTPEPVCYTFERHSDTACESCSSDDDCTTSLDEVCRSRCGGGKTADNFFCVEGAYCGEKANPDSCD